MLGRCWLRILGAVALWATADARALLADEPPAVAAPSTTASPLDEDYELYKVFVDTLDQVERNYVKGISRRELIEAAIRGVLGKLDPYSNYISPDELGRFRTSVENRFGGIGIQIDVADGQLQVVSPLAGTPAYRAGIIAGDRIVEIDGKATQGITVEEAVGRMKGEAGTQVTLTVVHAHTGKREAFTLTREVIRVESVCGDHRASDGTWDYMLDDEHKIGYLRVTAFSRDTTDEVKTALDSLTARGLQGLVLDLRFNPGGLLTSAIEISDLFVAQGRIVSTAGRNSPERVWDAEKPGTFEGFPMAVLVNGFSASASEIVAACLQDHGRAVVIGERTWGKGSVQNVIELEGGRSALKLTTASYVRPSGKNIHRFPDSEESDEWGVSPNAGYELKLSMLEMRSLIEDRRQRDIIRAPRPELAAQTGDTAPAAPAASEKPPEETGAAPENEAPAAPGAESPPAEAPATESPTSEAVPSDAPATPPPAEGAAAPPSSCESSATEGAIAPAGEASQPASEEASPEPAAPAPAGELPAEHPPVGDKPAAEGGGPPEKQSGQPFVDRQLAKAIEYLLAQIEAQGSGPATP